VGVRRCGVTDRVREKIGPITDAGTREANDAMKGGLEMTCR
jgi:hypothetical protein